MQVHIVGFRLAIAKIENTSASASNSEYDAVTDATIGGHQDMENLTTVRIVTMDDDGDSGGDVIEALPETFYETITSSEAVKEESHLQNAVFDSENEATNENISTQNATIIPVDTFEEGSSVAEDTELYLTEETNEVQIENVHLWFSEPKISKIQLTKVTFNINH